MVFVEQVSDLGMWMPKIGEELVGEVTKMVDGIYGRNVEVKKLDGTCVLTPSHKVLQARLGKVKVGDKVRITYVKEELPKIRGNHPTRIYKVEIDQVVEELVK